jgi:hypothetical protein
VSLHPSPGVTLSSCYGCFEPGSRILTCSGTVQRNSGLEGKHCVHYYTQSTLQRGPTAVNMQKIHVFTKRQTFHIPS